MKKHLLITSLILSMSACPVMAEFNGSGDFDDMFEQFYESPSTQIPDVGVVKKEHVVRGMPLFKKTRIKVTNYLREREYKKELKQQEKNVNLQNEESEENEIKVNFADPVVSQDTLELEGGVKEHVSSNDVLLDADNLDYNDETMDIIATGSPVLEFPPQDVKIKADKMIYNKAANTLKAYGKVEVIKSGNSTFGDYLQINLNEENAVLDNIKTNAAFMTVTSRKAELDGNKVVLYDGKMLSENSYILNLHTKMVGGNSFTRFIIDDEDRSSISNDVGETAVNIKAKDIIVNAKKDHNTITLKKAQVNYGDTKLFKFNSMTFHTNKNSEFFEGNYPELGSRGRLGMFAGPGFVIDTPLQNGSTLKLIPIINSKSGIGVGGLVKYRSATNYTDFGYGSSADTFILRGKQYLDDKLYLQYGSNSYMNEWWFGPRMAKYSAELIYNDETVVPSTVGKDLDLRFRHRLGLGYMHNNDYNQRKEDLSYSNVGTLRTRYMAEVDQTLFKYEDREKLRAFNFGWLLQGSAALYGTGDTQFVGRMGPRVHTQYKYWMQDISFFMSAYQDGTPMQMYDCYRYGHANLFIREALRVNKYLTLAWAGSLTLGNDSPNGKMFQENAFIIALGPDDFKINFGYDWVRKHTYFAFVIAMDTKGSSVDFEKLTIKNPDRLGKSQEKVELKVYDIENQTADARPKKMMYAEVIDIEDPDREDI